MTDYKKGGPVFEMFQDYWTLLKSIWMYSDTDAYWMRASQESLEFCDKHPGQFAVDLSVALLEEIERRYKKDMNKIPGQITFDQKK